MNIRIIIIIVNNNKKKQESKLVHQWNVEEFKEWIKHNSIICNRKKLFDDSIDGLAFFSFREMELQSYGFELDDHVVMKFIQEHQPQWPKDPEQCWRLRSHSLKGTKKIAQDFKIAYQLFKIAANPNHPDALHSLGYCYYTGKGVTRNISEAMCCYRRAASYKNMFSVFCLGSIYKKGKYVTQDLKAAFYYYKIAVVYRNIESISNYSSRLIPPENENIPRSRYFCVCICFIFFMDTKGKSLGRIIKETDL